jgi:hypothetical protein
MCFAVVGIYRINLVCNYFRYQNWRGDFLFGRGVESKAAAGGKDEVTRFILQYSERGVVEQAVVGCKNLKILPVKFMNAACTYTQPQIPTAVLKNSANTVSSQTILRSERPEVLPIIAAGAALRRNPDIAFMIFQK